MTAIPDRSIDPGRVHSRWCLIYDHLFRREASDGLRHYPPEILSIHEQFTWVLRKNVRAVADICWGRCVEKRMKKKLCLSQLPLRGQYKDINLRLEWGHPQDSSHRSCPARFVVFVMHPEAMIYANRSTQGKLQDLHLSITTLLGNITIDQDFCETNHRRDTYGRLTKVDWVRQKGLNEEAREHVLNCAKVTSTATESPVHRSQPGNWEMVSLPELSGNQLIADTVEDNEFDEVPSETQLLMADSQVRPTRHG